MTAIVDDKGIEAIRKINTATEAQLSDEDRSALAFYTALQFIRTPRHREETDKLLEAQTLYFMRKDLASPDKVHMTKEQILSHKPKNKHEEEALKKISEMTEKEINSQLFQTIHGDDIRMGLTKTGHSKGIMKVERHAKDLFEDQWLFLVAPLGTAFVTSDNPCFTISTHGILNGLRSPHSTVIFPLRPDVCIYIKIKPQMKSKTEHFLVLKEEEVEEMNRMIMAHAYEAVIAKDKHQLTRLVKDFDYKSHRKSRDVKISEKGPYVAFTLQ